VTGINIVITFNVLKTLKRFKHRCRVSAFHIISSAGKAEKLETEPENLRKGDYLALHRSKVRILVQPDQWELLAEDGSWKLYRKR
jgi:hypothetical protein